MKINKLLLLLMILNNLLMSHSYPKFLCNIYTPNSVFAHIQDFHQYFYFIGNKARYATCSGAAWFHNNYLASLNLHGKKINTYKFEEQTKIFECIQELGTSNNPENLDFSPDGTMLAVSFGGKKPGVALYNVDIETHLVNPEPFLLIPGKALTHGVRFTPDGNYLASTSWDKGAALCVYKIVRNHDDVAVECVCKKHNITKGVVKPKAIIFTRDHKLAVVSYTVAASVKQTEIKNYFAVYPFDANTGMLGDPVTIQIVEGLVCPDDLAFIENDHVIVASSQGNDTVVFYQFDPIAGVLGKDYVSIKNPEAQLSFPHGLAVSPNGKFLVVTNYGTDSFNLYELA